MDIQNTTIFESKKTTRPFLAIVLATNRPVRICEFLNNLQATAADPHAFEVLIRADEHDDATIQAICEQFEKVSFRICLLVEPNVKITYQLHKAYNKLIKYHMSSSVYFVCNLTDEIRFNTPGWDNIIKPYIRFYPDDIFRLTFSRNKLRNYYQFEECLYFPDNYPIITKKWLELCNGWGDFWGTDSWQQAVTYYLGLCKPPQAHEGVFRSIPLYDIEVQGQENGVGLTGARLEYQKRVVHSALMVLRSHTAKLYFARLAARLALHICAVGEGLSSYLLKEDKKNKLIAIYTLDKSRLIYEINYRALVDNSLTFESWIKHVYWMLHLQYAVYKLKMDKLLQKIAGKRTANTIFAVINWMEPYLKGIAKLIISSSLHALRGYSCSKETILHFIKRVIRKSIHVAKKLVKLLLRLGKKCCVWWRNNHLVKACINKVMCMLNPNPNTTQYYEISQETSFVQTHFDNVADMIDSVL